MNTLREKFKKKKIKRHIPEPPVEEKIKQGLKQKKLKRKKIHVKEKCYFVSEEGKRCSNNAIGSGQLCKKHGGTIDTSNTLNSFALELLKNEMGYVTKFDPAIHPLVMIDFSRQGMSDTEIAAEIGVSIATLRKWAETYEEMSIAYEIGQALHESWWLAKGKSGLDSKFFNTSLYKFLTGNKLGYADKIETKNTNTNLHGVLVVPASKTLEQWEKEGSIDI